MTKGVKPGFQTRYPGGPAMQHGLATVTLSAAVSAHVHVTFPRPFPGSPHVVATPKDSNYSAAYFAEDATGVDIYVTRVDGVAASTTVAVGWIAVYG